MYREIGCFNVWRASRIGVLVFVRVVVYRKAYEPRLAMFKSLVRVADGMASLTRDRDPGVDVAH